MPNTTIRCPNCSDQFTIPVHCLSDDLGVPKGKDEIARICGCY